MYGLNFYHLTEGQQLVLERINRGAMRVVTGLPKFPTIDNFHMHWKMNTREVLAKGRKSARIARLEGTTQWRQIFQYVGYDLHGCYPFRQCHLLGDIALVDHRPTVKNISKGQKARRKSAASKHASGVSELDQVQNIRPYLDAAEIKGRQAIAWFRSDLMTRGKGAKWYIVTFLFRMRNYKLFCLL